MEWVSFPRSLLDDGIVEVTIFVDDVVTLAGFLGHFGLVRAHEELPLEQLDTDDSKHEDQEESDEDDIADGLDGNNDALNNMLEALGSIDGSERTEYTQYPENLHHRYSTRTASKNEPMY